MRVDIGVLAGRRDGPFRTENGRRRALRAARRFKSCRPSRRSLVNASLIWRTERQPIATTSFVNDTIVRDTAAAMQMKGYNYPEYYAATPK